MAAMATTEYKLINYDGGFKSQPEAGLAGSVEVGDDGKWRVNLGFRKHVTGDFKNFPFEVQALAPTSCRLTVRNVHNPSYNVNFDLPDTSAEAINGDLANRKYELTSLMAAGEQVRQRVISGQWWAKVSEFKIGMGYHYSGERQKNQTGTMFAGTSGIDYKSFGGKKVHIPWNVIQDVEISTQAARRVTAARVLAVGVFALAAKKNETYTYVHISDQNTVWSFATKSSQGNVVKVWQPILNAWNNREGAQAARTSPSPTPTTPPPPTGPALSVADELKKLGELKDSGLLSDEEFAQQKAKLLGS